MSDQPQADKMYYLISDGDYEYWKLDALLVGAKEQSIDALYKQFIEVYAFPESPELHTEVAAHNRAEAAGLTGGRRSQYFADWLVKHHRFERIEFQEINFDFDALVYSKLATTVSLLAE